MLLYGSSFEINGNGESKLFIPQEKVFNMLAVVFTVMQFL